MIRIAWCDKLKQNYYYGGWNDKTEKNIKLLKNWTNHQNTIRHDEYYWLEIIEDNKINNYIENVQDIIEKDYVELVLS